MRTNSAVSNRNKFVLYEKTVIALCHKRLSHAHTSLSKKMIYLDINGACPVNMENGQNCTTCVYTRQTKALSKRIWIGSVDNINIHADSYGLMYIPTHGGMK